MRIILTIILFGCFLVNAWAQAAIKLKTGATVEGKVIEQNKDYVKVDVLGTEITYWSDEIENIQDLGQAPTPQEQKIMINGQVVYEEYSEGPISIAAFDSPDPKSRKAIARAKLDKPGKFTLKVPAGTKQVYISAYNDKNNDKRPDKEETSFRAGNGLNTPIPISGADLNDIVLQPYK